MANIFDSIQDNAFGVVTSTFGIRCDWQPVADDSEPQAAFVLYNTPTKDNTTGSVHFDIMSYWMEYKKGDLQGLFESVADGQDETVTIENEGVFICQNAKAINDGKSYVIELIKL